MARGAVGRGWALERLNIPLKRKDMTLMVTLPRLSCWVKGTYLPMGRAMVRWHTARRWVSCCSMNSWSLHTNAYI